MRAVKSGEEITSNYSDPLPMRIQPNPNRLTRVTPQNFIRFLQQFTGNILDRQISNDIIKIIIREHNAQTFLAVTLWCRGTLISMYLYKLLFSPQI